MKKTIYLLSVCVLLFSCKVSETTNKENIDQKAFQKSDYAKENNPIANWLADFEPTATIIIGPEREYKSLFEYFSQNYEESNVYVLVEEGTYYSDGDIIIMGNNVVVEGVGNVHHYCNQLYTSVLDVFGNNIMIKNLHLQHTQPGDPEHQNCSGRVIMFDNAHNCIIDNCDLNGCGLAGLHDNMGNSDILIRNCYIHNNSLGAYTDIEGGVWQEAIKDHPVFQFENNKIKNNGPDRVPE